MVTVPTKKTSDIATAGSPRQLQNITAPAAAFGSVQAQNTLDAAASLERSSDQTAQLANNLQRREDETKLLEYQTQLEQYETDTLYTGKNAVLNRDGNASFGSTKKSLADFDKFTGELDKNLTTKRQRFMAQRARSNARNSMARTISRHESSQRKVWESAVRNAALESAHDKAILSFTDKEERTKSLEKIEALVRDKNRGLPREAVDQLVEAEKTKAHTAIVERYSIDSLESAEIYFEENKDEIDAHAQIRIEKSLGVLNKQRQAVVKNEINKEIQVIQDSFSMGIDVPDAQVNAVKTVAEKNGLEVQSKALGQMQELFDFNQDFLDVPLEDQPKQIKELRQSIEQKPTRQKLSKYKMLQSSFDTKIKALTGPNPVAYYEQRKEIRPYKELNVSDSAQMRYEIEQRRVAAYEVEKKEGIKLPLMKPAEIDATIKAYNNGSEDQKVGLLKNIAESFNQDEARRLGKRIAPQQKNMAVVMSIVHEAPDVAAKVASGSTRDKFVGANAVSVQLQEDLEGAVQDGVAMEAITASVHDLYTQLAFEANDTTKELDPDRLKQATDAILGPKMKVKTSILDGTPSHILPFRMESGQWISENQFESALKTIDLQTMLKTQGDTFKATDGTNLDVQETIGRTKLVNVGDGKYELHTAQGQQIMGTDPKPFVLDMKKVVNSDNIKGFFETVTEGFSQSELDDFVDASQELSGLIESKAPEADIEDARNTLNKLRENSERKAKQRNLKSIKEGF